MTALYKEVIDSIASKYTTHIRSAVTLREVVQAMRTHVKPTDTEVKATAVNSWKELLRGAGRGTVIEA